MKRKLFSILALLFAVSTAWAQVTQYKYGITATFTKDDSWDNDGDFTNTSMMLVSGMGQCSFGYDHLFTPGTIDISYYGYYKRDDQVGYDEFQGGEYTIWGFEYNIDGSKNGVTLQQNNFSVKLNNYVTINFQYKGTVTSYTISYETDIDASAAWYYTKPTLSVSNNNVYTQLHCYEGYTLRHLIMRDASGNETELSFTKGTYTYGAIENQYGSAGQTVATYSASFTMPAKNVTIRAVFNKQTPTVTPPTAIAGLVYDGQPHQLITAGSTTGGTMKYKLENGNWGTSIPEATNAGTYKVYYKVDVDGNDEYENVGQQDLTVNIAQAKNTITAPTARTLTYDGTAQALLNAGSATFGTMEYSTTDAGGPYSTTIPTRTDATPNNSYTVWYRVLGNDNYTGQGSTVIHVPIAQCPVTVTATGHTLTTTYDGQSHSVSGFDVSMSNNLYTTSDFTYTRETELSSTNAVVLTFQIHTSGFENLNNNFAPTFVIASPIRLVIQQKAVVVTADNVTKEQGDDDNLTATVTGVVSDESPAVIYYTLNREAGEDIGTYTITPTGNASQLNYSVTFAPGTLTISPKTIAANPDGNGNYWATYYNGTKSYAADFNTTIYKGAVSDNKVLLTAVDDIPAGNAVILKSKASPITLTLTSATTADFTGNDLQGRDHELDASGMSYAYCLSKGVNGVGFYKYTGNGGSEIIPAHRAFLEIYHDSNNAPGRGFYGFDEDNGEATSVSEELKVKSDESTVYDLQGRQIVNGKSVNGNLQPGMYIVNGKKVFIK